MPPTQVAKFQAHAEHLLDLFIGLREKYALLDPMVFDRETVRSRGAGRQARGFSILRNVLAMSCVLDTVKISLDKDKRTPSVTRLVQALDREDVRSALREAFAVRNAVPTSGHPPEILAAIAAAERRDEDERRQEFDGLLDRLRQRWGEFAGSAHVRSFETLRDKHVAHAELHHDGSKYRPLDVESLGLTWEHLKTALAQLQELVTLVTAIYRSAAFAFDDLDRQLGQASTAFWASAR